MEIKNIKIIRDKTGYWEKLSNKPYSETEQGWSLWENQAKKSYPIRFFLFETLVDFIDHNIFTKLKNLKWAILHRIHPKYIYHKLRIKKLNKDGKLENIRPRFYDEDVLLELVMIQIFIEYFEDERGFNRVDWVSSGDEHYEISKKMKKAYEFFTITQHQLLEKTDDHEYYNYLMENYNKRDNQFVRNRLEELSKDLQETEKHYENELNKNLKMIIDFRKYMWT